MSVKIYLAIPYTGYEEQAFKLVNKYAAWYHANGYIVYSPISHWHPIAIQEKLPGNWEFWEKQDTAFLSWSDEIHVIDAIKDSIVNSKGVNKEVNKARKLQKRIEIIPVQDNERFWFLSNI